jgi:general secretion pathway protein D
MTRFIDRIRLHVLVSQPLCILICASALVVATAMTTSVNAQDSEPVEEPSIDEPVEEPVIEDGDDVVIPDAPEEVIEEEVVEEEVVEEEVEEEVVLPEPPEVTAEEQVRIEEAEALNLQRQLGEISKLEAADAAKAGRWRESASKYLEANGYLPNDPEIIQGLQHAYSMLDQGPLLDQYQKQVHMEREAARAMFDAAIGSANQRLMRQDFDYARREVERAIVRLERNDKSLFSEVEFNQRLSTAKTLLSQIAQQNDQWQQQRLLQEAAERSAAQSNRQMEEAKKRIQLINNNMKRVRQLQLEHKYAQALDIVNEILFIDEHNAGALVLRDALQQTMIYREWDLNQRAKEYGFSGLRVDNEGALVTPQVNYDIGQGDLSTNELMSYPNEWLDLTERRAHSVSGFSETYENRAIKVAMEKTTHSSHDFGGRTFEEAIDEIKEEAKLESAFFEDWSRIASALDMNEDDVKGIMIEDLQMGDIPLMNVLRRILSYVNVKNEAQEDADMRIWFDIRDGVLEISMEKALTDHTYIEVYNVTDLLFEIRDFWAPPLALGGGGGTGGGGGGGGRGGGGGGAGGGGSIQGIFGSASANGPMAAPGGGSGGAGGGSGGGGGGGGSGGIGQGEEQEAKTREELMEELSDLITKYITSPTGAWEWDDDGQHEIDALNNNFIIKQTPGVHREITSLLAKLREVRALQFNVESRFLQISTDWFEQIGFDLDLYFNTNDGFFDAVQDYDENAQLSDFFAPGTAQFNGPLIYGGFEDDGNGNMVPSFPATNTATGHMVGLLQPDGTIDYQMNADGRVFGLAGPAGNGLSPLGIVQGHDQLIKTIGNFSSFGKTIVNSNPALGFGLQFLDDVQVDLMIEATQADQRNTILTAPRLTLHNGQRAWIQVTRRIAYVASLELNSNSGAIGYQPVIEDAPAGFSFEIHGVISADRRYVTMEVDFVITEVEFNATADFEAAAAGGSDGGGSAVTIKSSVDLPTSLDHRIRTTVSVPDKGTALLGGQRTVREYETEVGVPILSKIPYLNRFFTNRTTSREESTLLILLRPEIIIQQENEEMLFTRSLLDSGSSDSFLR